MYKPQPKQIYDYHEVKRYLKNKYRELPWDKDFWDLVKQDYGQNTVLTLFEDLDEEDEYTQSYKDCLKIIMKEFGLSSTFGKYVQIHFWW